MSVTADRILLASNDPRLLFSRELVLKQAGFIVASIGKEALVSSIPQDPPVGLLILGHSLSPEEQDDLIHETRKRWSSAKILRLIIGDDTMRKIFPGEYAYSSIDPRNLISACHHLLSDK